VSPSVGRHLLLSLYFPFLVRVLHVYRIVRGARGCLFKLQIAAAGGPPQCEMRGSMFITRQESILLLFLSSSSWNLPVSSQLGGQRNVCSQLLKGGNRGKKHCASVDQLASHSRLLVYLSAFLGPEMLMPGLKQRFG